MKRPDRDTLLAASRSLPPLLLFASLFLPWWIIHIDSGLGDEWIRFRPFHDEGVHDADDEDLNDETWFTGAVALIAICAGIAQSILAARDPDRDPLRAKRRLILNAMAASLTLLAILYTALQWPAGIGDGELTFYDEEDSGPPPQSSEPNQIIVAAHLTARGGLGWGFAIATGLAHTILSLVDARARYRQS